MKEILISVRPEWCAKIANGKKTVGEKKIEIRKTIPQCKAPFKCYIYCTKGNFALLRDEEATDSKYKYDVWKTADFHQNVGKKTVLNGKIIGEFICDSISTYESEFTSYDLESDTQESIQQFKWDDDSQEYNSSTICTNEGETADEEYLNTNLYQKSLVSYTALKKYVGLGIKKFYGWHISQLVIYDEPKSLSEFPVVDTEAVNNCAFRNRVYVNPDYTNNALLKGGYVCTKTAEPDWCTKCFKKTLSKPPQSWCYIQKEESQGDNI